MNETRDLSQGLVELYVSGGVGPIQDAASRSLFNVLGTTVAGSRTDVVDILIEAASAHVAPGSIAVPARKERLDVMTAALVVGAAAHVDDFDDTHLETVIHPGAATLAAALSLGQLTGSSGAKLLSAFALGCEAQLRIGVAMSPSHYDLGWHITGTCGVLGAAVAASLLLESDEEQLSRAIALAASQTLGTRAALGNMAKAFHPGKAAANGILAAMLAKSGFEGPEAPLEREDGLLHAMSDYYDPGKITAGLGHSWQLAANTFKPYPCGIVSHPAIDAAVLLHGRWEEAGSAVQNVEIFCHPLVVELTGAQQPNDGLEARFSTIHGVVAGLMDGVVGLPQYEDARVTDGATADLRARATLVVDPAYARDQARVSISLEDGTILEEDVRNARGSVTRPLTDDELFAKVEQLVEPILPGRTALIRDAVQQLPVMPSLAPLLAATAVGTTAAARAAGSFA